MRVAARGRRDQQVFTPTEGVAVVNAAETAAQPSVGERGVHRYRSVEIRDRFASPVLCSQQETFQRDGLGVGWCKREAFVQSFERAVSPAKLNSSSATRSQAKPNSGELVVAWLANWSAAPSESLLVARDCS
jgi:hypothetical protein